MKKALFIILTLSIVLTLTACEIGSNKSAKDNIPVNKPNIEENTNDSNPEENVSEPGVEEGTDIVPDNSQMPIDEDVPEDTKDVLPVKLTEVVVEPKSKPSIGFSFSLPEGWTYEVEYSDDESWKRISAYLKPEADGIEGDIAIEYMEFFGVCGTGLSIKEIDFNGYKAAMGYYDNSPIWSFIILKGDYDNCVIINSAHNWYKEYEDEIDIILSSVRFKYYE